MDKVRHTAFLADKVIELDEARNARPSIPQQASEMVNERNARLASEGDKIAALRKAREARGPIPAEVAEDAAPKHERIDTGTGQGDKRQRARLKQDRKFAPRKSVSRKGATRKSGSPL